MNLVREQTLLDLSTVLKIKEEAKKKHISKAAVIRQIIEEYFSKKSNG